MSGGDPIEMFVHAAMYAFIATAAWTLGRTNPSHRIIAAVFVVDLFADVGRIVLAGILDAETPPYTGHLLVVYYIDHALFASLRFALLAACLRHFEQRSIRPALYAFAIAVAGMVLFKETTGASLLPVHHAMAAATTGAGWILAVRAILAPASRIQIPDGAHAVLLLILALMLVKVCLHYFGPVDETWSDVRKSDIFVHGLIATGYLGALVRHGVRRWRAYRS